MDCIVAREEEKDATDKSQLASLDLEEVMGMNRGAAPPRRPLIVLLAGCLLVVVGASARADAATGGRLLVENGLGRTPQMG